MYNQSLLCLASTRDLTTLIKKIDIESVQRHIYVPLLGLILMQKNEQGNLSTISSWISIPTSNPHMDFIHLSYYG
jgi:hypothetical protein